MAFSEQLDSLDAAVREHLTDPAELRPVGGGEPRVVPVQIDEPTAPPSGLGAPVLQATITVAVADATLEAKQIYMPGRYVDGLFVCAPIGWRVCSAATKTSDGRWQTAAVERYRP